jgi:DNA repair photolyase
MLIYNNPLMVSIDKVGYGEYLLLAEAPMFKRRYTVDGDVILGCTIGCEFCYYRMIDTTAPYNPQLFYGTTITPKAFEMLSEAKESLVDYLVSQVRQNGE